MLGNALAIICIPFVLSTIYFGVRKGENAYGVRDVLAHKVPENSERHIRYAVLTESREELLSS